MAPTVSDDALGPEQAATPPDQRRARRGNYPVGTARRAAIVEAAVEVFSTAGFHKGSLRDVADRVGISQAGLLHHFPSKERLAQAVLTWRDDGAVAYLGDPPPTGADLLRGLVGLADYNSRTPELVELHVILSGEAASADHPLHEYFVRRYERVFGMIRTAFEAAEGDGQLRPGVDCGTAARTLIALMDGLQVQWLLHREAVDMAGDLRRYVQSQLSVEF
jgi:AcrR family transcriptional regulator